MSFQDHDIRVRALRDLYNEAVVLAEAEGFRVRLETATPSRGVPSSTRIKGYSIHQLPQRVDNDTRMPFPCSGKPQDARNGVKAPSGVPEGKRRS